MNRSLLRLLDANANRAREALRVLEDYARFVLNDQTMSAGLKELRHTLAETTGPYLPDAILHRDTPGDVGTTNKTAAEQKREDLAHIVTAAGKRLGEALRSIEEYLKTVAPADAARVEALRYAFYDIEQRLARTLRRVDRFAHVRLYVLITEKLCRGAWLETAELALQGGADCVQLREKEMDGGELLTRARQLVALCRKFDAICILNDRPDIALLADADGVHIGQQDLPAVEARKLVGAEKIVGVSTHCIEQARQAVLDGADYIGVGPFFRSATKPRDILPGPAYARQVSAEVAIPAVAIAGITAENVDEVLACGIRAVAVSSAIIGASDVRRAAEQLKRKLVEQTFLSASAGADDVLSVGQTFLSASSVVEPTPPVGRTFLSAVSGVDKNPVGQTFLSVAPTADVTKGIPELTISHRRLPHWRLAGSVYFLTFRVAERNLEASDRAIVLNHVKSGHGKFYSLFAAVIMPDHAHVLLKPNEGIELGRILKGIKGVSARLLNTIWHTKGSVWQDESWDRIIRDQAELDEKIAYMLHNPAKKGLVNDPWEYDGWYLNRGAG